MATSSGIADYKINRNDLIEGALRIIGGLAQGQTPSNVQYAEATEALNLIIKELGAVHGMPLWKIKTSVPITMVANQREYKIGLDAGNDIIEEAPLKIVEAWLRTTQNTDQPINLISKSAYDTLSSKYSTGTPNQLFYKVPGTPQGNSNQGVLYLYLTPDSTAVSTYTLFFTGVYSIENMDNSTDIPDFPQYWYNAIKWALADQLAYEYGLGVTEKAQISKKAKEHIENAFGGSPEEGSMFIQPRLSFPNP